MTASGEHTATLVYLLMAMIVFGSAAFAARRRALEVDARGPGAILSLLIWLSLIALALLIYRGAQVWAAILSLFQ